MASIRPSTCSGTPQIIRSGAGPSRSGQVARTRSRLPPMPPEVTITAGACSSNSPTRTRELRVPRPAWLGSRIAPRTPSTAPREPPHPHAVQPGSLLPGGEVDVGLRPAVRPVVLARRVVGSAVEERAAHPVLPGQRVRVPDAHPALLGAADQQQAAERPEGLAAQVRLGFLVEQQHPPSGPGQLRGSGQSRQPRAHHDRIRVHLVIKPGHRSALQPGGALVRRWAAMVSGRDPRVGPLESRPEPSGK
jgi:hypothetical protein